MRKNILIRNFISTLANLSIEELRREWAAAWGLQPHARIGRSMLEKSLAYKQRGQGLTADQQKRLEQLIKQYKGNPNCFDEIIPALKPGTRLVRNWNGIRHSVLVWVHYFSETILDAQQDFITTIDFLVKKTAFFDRYKSQLNEAQSKVLYKMLEDGETVFVGGMNARKYQSISRVSKATATRHLQDLVEKGLLIPHQSGRSTNYQVKLS